MEMRSRSCYIFNGSKQHISSTQSLEHNNPPVQPGLVVPIQSCELSLYFRYEAVK